MINEPIRRQYALPQVRDHIKKSLEEILGFCSPPLSIRDTIYSSEDSIYIINTETGKTKQMTSNKAFIFYSNILKKFNWVSKRNLNRKMEIIFKEEKRYTIEEFSSIIYDLQFIGRY